MDTIIKITNIYIYEFLDTKFVFVRVRIIHKFSFPLHILFSVNCRCNQFCKFYFSCGIRLEKASFSSFLYPEGSHRNHLNCKMVQKLDNHSHFCRLKRQKPIHPLIESELLTKDFSPKTLHQPGIMSKWQPEMQKNWKKRRKRTTNKFQMKYISNNKYWIFRSVLWGCWKATKLFV